MHNLKGVFARPQAEATSFRFAEATPRCARNDEAKLVRIAEAICIEKPLNIAVRGLVSYLSMSLLFLKLILAFFQPIKVQLNIGIVGRGAIKGFHVFVP